MWVGGGGGGGGVTGNIWNKSREFPDLVPFLLSVFGVLRSLLVITGRKTDSDSSELPKEEELPKWYLESVSNDREYPFVVC